VRGKGRERRKYFPRFPFPPLHVIFPNKENERSLTFIHLSFPSCLSIQTAVRIEEDTINIVPSYCQPYHFNLELGKFGKTREHDTSLIWGCCTWEAQNRLELNQFWLKIDMSWPFKLKTCHFLILSKINYFYDQYKIGPFIK